MNRHLLTVLLAIAVLVLGSEILRRDRKSVV